MQNTIANDAAVARPNSDATAGISLTAARLSMVLAAAALVFLAALHVLSPELDVTWRMVSEYALGNYGWVLALLFLSMSFSCVTLFWTVRSQVKTLGGKIGLFFLIAAAVGLGMAAAFDVNHDLHGVAALIGMPSFPIAAMLVSVSLVRNPDWSGTRRALLWTANLTWFSLALMFAVVLIGLELSGGEFGPHILAGLPNRLLVVAYNVWVITVAWQAVGLRGQEN